MAHRFRYRRLGRLVGSARFAEKSFRLDYDHHGPIVQDRRADHLRRLRRRDRGYRPTDHQGSVLPPGHLVSIPNANIVNSPHRKCLAQPGQFGGILFLR